MLFDTEVVSVPDQPDKPLVGRVTVDNAGGQLGALCFVTLPGQMDDSAPGEHRGAEIAGHSSFVKKAQRIKHGALSCGVGADEEIQGPRSIVSSLTLL